MKDITAVFTSCGRWDLLEQTVSSFVKTNTYQIYKFIIVDNSTNEDASEAINKITNKLNIEALILINSTNIGQVASIDKAYSHITSEYIFHCEDDWLFTGSNYIEQSLDVIDSVSKIVNVNLRFRFDGEKGGDSPIEPLQQTANGTRYHLYELNYLNMWHGFSWNPGLRKLTDYNIIGSNYKNIGQEQDIGQLYMQLGYRAACLEKQYAKHIGGNSMTPLSNQ